MKQNDLKFIHDTIIHWIDRTDVKANIFLGIQLAILGYLLPKVACFYFDYYHKAVLFGWITSALLDLFLIFRVIWPKLSTDEPKSFIYFKHIHAKYAGENLVALRDFSKVNEKAFDEDLVNQIISLSTVATEKYIILQKVVILIGFQIALIILLIVT